MVLENKAIGQWYIYRRNGYREYLWPDRSIRNFMTKFTGLNDAAILKNSPGYFTTQEGAATVLCMYNKGVDVSDLITPFVGDNEFLCNFHMSPVTYKQKEYPSVEHAYQAAKAVKSKDHDKIQAAETPGKAKRLGQKIVKRTDWNKVKTEVM